MQSERPYSGYIHLGRPKVKNSEWMCPLWKMWVLNPKWKPGSELLHNHFSEDGKLKTTQWTSPVWKTPQWTYPLQKSLLQWNLLSKSCGRDRTQWTLPQEHNGNPQKWKPPRKIFSLLKDHCDNGMFYNESPHRLHLHNESTCRGSIPSGSPHMGGLHNENSQAEAPTAEVCIYNRSERTPRKEWCHNGNLHKGNIEIALLKNWSQHSELAPIQEQSRKKSIQGQSLHSKNHQGQNLHSLSLYGCNESAHWKDLTTSLSSFQGPQNLNSAIPLVEVLITRTTKMKVPILQAAGIE